LAGRDKQLDFPTAESGYVQSADNLLPVGWNGRANFDSPGDHATVGNNFGVNVSTTSLNKITKVEIFANGVSRLVITDRSSDGKFDGNVQLDDGTYDLSATVTDSTGATFNRDIHIGVNKPWDWSPSPTPTMTPIPTITPTMAPRLLV